MERLPLITVVTVCYNCVKVIERTILSVLSQSYPNVEYIVVDGGSTDGTIDVIKKYNDKITNWISEPDGGVYFGMNKGIAMAHGDWINFMNAGDTFVSNDVLEQCFSKEIYSDGVDLLCGDTICSFPWANYLRVGKNPDGNINFCHQSVFTRATLLKQNPYDISYRIIADNVWFQELMSTNHLIKYIPVRIAVYEGYAGISARNAINFYKEVSKKNHTPQDLRWKLSILKLKLKLFMQSLEPIAWRDSKWERKLDKTLIRL